MPDMTGFVGGQWNAECDVCGRVFKSAQLSRAWDYSMRCRECWETRQPQDFVRAIPEDTAAPWSREWVPTYSAVANSSLPIALVVVLPNPAVPVWLLTGGGGPLFNGILPLTANRLVTLIFDQAGATLANGGGNIVINSGNYVTKAGDSFQFRCDGTKWREVSRTVS